MAETAKNLHRREIGEVERAELIAEWIQLQKERKKAAKKVRQAGALKEPGKGRGSVGGLRQAARDLGVPEQTVRRAVRIASLSDDAKEAAKASGLDDNQSASRERSTHRIKMSSEPAECLSSRMPLFCVNLVCRSSTMPFKPVK